MSRPGWLPRPASVRRRIAVATWKASKDGRIYSRISVDATELLAYLAQTRERTGERVTITHAVGAAVGRAVRATPEIRARIVFGRIVPVPTCDIGFAVDVERGRDLAPIKVHGVDRLSPVEISRALSGGAKHLRAGRDPNYRRSSQIVSKTPTWAMRPLLAGVSLLSGGLGVSAFGQPGFPLGSAFVSNVGSLGLEEGFLAPVPFARVPLYMSIGTVRDAALVIDGEVAVRKLVVLGATADHRLVDGAHAGQMVTLIRDLLEHPQRLDEPFGAPEPVGLETAVDGRLRRG